MMGSRTSIPFEQEKEDTEDKRHLFDASRKVGFPSKETEYEIVGRLSARTRENIYEKGLEDGKAKGWEFDSMFISANYFVFIKYTGRKY
jgi:hypothetical protein